MGGWMTYQRVRNRNNIMLRKPDDDPDPYPREAAFAPQRVITPMMLIGDLNRMERDYLDPKYPEPPFATRPQGSSPAEEVAKATGVDVEIVRKVLKYVFLEQQ